MRSRHGKTLIVNRIIVGRDARFAGSVFGGAELLLSVRYSYNRWPGLGLPSRLYGGTVSRQVYGKEADAALTRR